MEEYVVEAGTVRSTTLSTMRPTYFWPLGSTVSDPSLEVKLSELMSLWD